MENWKRQCYRRSRSDLRSDANAVRRDVSVGSEQRDVVDKAAEEVPRSWSYSPNRGDIFLISRGPFPYSSSTPLAFCLYAKVWESEPYKVCVCRRRLLTLDISWSRQTTRLPLISVWLWTSWVSKWRREGVRWTTRRGRYFRFSLSSFSLGPFVEKWRIFNNIEVRYERADRKRRMGHVGCLVERRGKEES